MLSHTAREVWLAEQCSAFESQIQKLSREREKDHFLEELYRKLKQVTRRWQLWNHKSFGGVTSRGFVTLFFDIIFFILFYTKIKILKSEEVTSSLKLAHTCFDSFCDLLKNYFVYHKCDCAHFPISLLISLFFLLIGL